MLRRHAWKWVAALAAVVAVGVFVWSLREPSGIPNSITLVCVETGEVFRIARNRLGSTLPALNPRTKRSTLVPCRVEEGELVMVPRFRHLLDDLQESNQYVDPQTLIVRRPS